MTIRSPNYLYYKAAEMTDAALRSMLFRIMRSDVFKASQAYDVVLTEITVRSCNRGFDLRDTRHDGSAW